MRTTDDVGPKSAESDRCAAEEPLTETGSRGLKESVPPGEGSDETAPPKTNCKGKLRVKDCAAEDREKDALGRQPMQGFVRRRSRPRAKVWG